MHPITFFQLLVTVLCVYRLTILVTQDIITKPIRDGIDRRFTGRLVEFVYCPRCVSFWIAISAFALTYYCWSWWQWVCAVFVASGVTGFLAERS